MLNTLYYTEFAGTHFVSDVVPTEDTAFDWQTFKFDPKELMMWTEIWVRQSGEEAVIFIGGLKHTIQKCNL